MSKKLSLEPEIPGISTEDVDEVEDREMKIWNQIPNGDKIAVAMLDGTAITVEGRRVKHGWLEGANVGYGIPQNFILKPEEIAMMDMAFKRVRLGASMATIMRCYGEKICPMADACPFVNMQRHLDSIQEPRSVIPLGMDCPVEKELFISLVTEYADHFEVTEDPKFAVDRRLIMELAAAEVLEFRMNSVLGTRYQDGTEDKILTISQTAEGPQEHHMKDIADAFKIAEKCQLRKDSIRKQLMATRHAKKSLETELVNNSASMATAKLMQQLQLIAPKRR